MTYITPTIIETMLPNVGGIQELENLNSILTNKQFAKNYGTRMDMCFNYKITAYQTNMKSEHTIITHGPMPECTLPPLLHPGSSQ